jgi:hypothetical protein
VVWAALAQSITYPPMQLPDSRGIMSLHAFEAMMRKPRSIVNPQNVAAAF